MIADQKDKIIQLQQEIIRLQKEVLTLSKENERLRAPLIIPYYQPLILPYTQLCCTTTDNTIITDCSTDSVSSSIKYDIFRF